MGFDEKLGGYVLRALLQRNHENSAYEAISKDLENVASGFGPTEKDAMTMLKANLKKKLTALVKDNKGRMPFTEISCVRTLGGRIVFLFVKLDPEPVVELVPKLEVETKSVTS